MYALIRQLPFITLACLSLAGLRCTSLQMTSGGTGSETVIGKLVNEDGSPARGTVVELRPYNFNPISDHIPFDFGTDTTDSSGRYAITLDSPTVKRFVVQAVNPSQGTRTLIPDIDLSASGDSVVIGTASLHKTGSIKVILSDSSISGDGYVYIPGTSFNASLENGYAIIDSVPAVTISQVNYNEIDVVAPPRSLAESVVVTPGIATIVAFSGWSHAAKIFLNTTSGGADVEETVYGFPVLIRLSNSNFNFNEARTDGSDICFTKRDNTPIPFEIERWDAAARQAEIWVKADTVYGNDSSNFFAMYWGEAATAMARNNERVFDTANGFKGVWHLAEEAAGVGSNGLYKDATGRNDGDDYISATGRSGIIGYGRAFDGIDDFIPVNSPVTEFKRADLTISLWVAISDSGGTMLSKLDTSPMWYFGESSFYFGDGTDTHVPPGVNGTYPSFVGFADSYAIAGRAVGPDGWHYLTYTWKWHGDNTGTSRFFIDGMEVPLSKDSVYIRVEENTDATIRIGQPNNNESYDFFNGLMDELRISAIARSADWIKLCFMNQRKENALVKF